MGVIEEMSKPKWILLSSDLAKAGTTLMTLEPLSPLRFRRDFRCSRTAANPIITLILTMFDPRTFPTESAAPPEKAAINATVNSGNDVENAIMLNPTDVFPSWVTVAILTALLMARLEAQFNTTNETAMTKTSITKPVSNISAMLHSPRFCPFAYPSIRDEPS